MIWLYVACVLLVVLTVAGFVFASHDWDTEIPGAIIGTISGILALIMIISTTVVTVNYVSAGPRAKLLNDSFGTHYTADDIFYGDDIVKEVIQGKRSRIDLNMTNDKERN